jgi:hypothetical protein
MLGQMSEHTIIVNIQNMDLLVFTERPELPSKPKSGQKGVD